MGNTYVTYKFRGIPAERTITIRSGNRKIGQTPNTSFPPVVTCPKDIMCADGCYMNKFLKIYPSIRKAYTRNYHIYRTSPVEYWNQVHDVLSRVRPVHFRYNVAGDIPDLQYASGIVRTAQEFPSTKFLVFTKQFDIISHRHIITAQPNNLQIIASGWPNVTMPKIIRDNYRIAWCDDGTETRIPADAFLCRDACEPCRHCYVDRDTDIILPFH